MIDKQYNRRLVNAQVQIRSADGKALANQAVTVEQTRHQFLFGTAAFDLLPLLNGDYSGTALAQAQERAANLAELCNAATLPFYWDRFEPQRGKPITAQIRKAAEWCKARGMTVKGHPLCWHTLTAPWLLDMSDEEILQAQLERIRRDVSEFKGLIDTWDVINEAVIMPVFDKYDNGITRLCKYKGRIQLIKTLFEFTRSINPTATLLINDFDTSVAYDILIEGCLEAGIHFDVIGIQSHMHQGWWGKEKTEEILERFGRFNLPLHFTETTLVSGHLMPPEIVDLNDYQVSDWPSTPEGEERQMSEAVQHYSTLFANPLVQSITWWDLADGNWLNAPGGLLRRDGSRKPAYDALCKLIKDEWWLAPTGLVSDEAGTVRFSGYPGDYRLRIGQKDFAIHLSEPGEMQTEITVSTAS